MTTLLPASDYEAIRAGLHVVMRDVREAFVWRETEVELTLEHWKMRLVYERELEFRKRCAEMGLR
jgi:hypothetical protein